MNNDDSGSLAYRLTLLRPLPFGPSCNFYGEPLAPVAGIFAATAAHIMRHF